MEKLIYFAECGGRIKIGISSNVPKRLEQLRAGSGGKIHLIACVVGDLSVERSLHKKLEKHRLDREWYHDHPEVRAAIQNSINNFPEPGRRVAASSGRTLHVRHWSDVLHLVRFMHPAGTAKWLRGNTGKSLRTVKYWLAEDRAPGADDALAIVAALRSEIKSRSEILARFKIDWD